MATIRRHPVPTESFRADAPLNDLLLKQFEHFVHVAERLPAKMRLTMPVPSPQDSAAAARYIAEVTERLMSRKRPPLTVVSQPRRKRTARGVSIAAAAETSTNPRVKRKNKPRKSKSRKTPKKSSGA
jgi:hypothetical protein